MTPTATDIICMAINRLEELKLQENYNPAFMDIGGMMQEEHGIQKAIDELYKFMDELAEQEANKRGQ